MSGNLQNTPVVEPGYMIGVDLMGPFPKSAKQNEHLLVTVDYCSKWVEVFPLRKAKAPQIAKILVEEIFTRWPDISSFRSRGTIYFSPTQFDLQTVGSGSKVDYGLPSSDQSDRAG